MPIMNCMLVRMDLCFTFRLLEECNKGNFSDMFNDMPIITCMLRVNYKLPCKLTLSFGLKEGIQAIYTLAI
jgi:hypothetical protein